MNYQEFPEGYFGDKNPDVLPTEKELISSLSSYKKHLVAFIKNLPPNAHVLDAGCGSGKTIKMIKVFRPDVKISGTDISDVHEFLPKEVDFKQASIEDYEKIYSENMFDAIICQHVIEHLYSPIPLITSFKYILKSGGKVFLETPNWTRLFTPFAHFFFWNDYTHVRVYTTFSLTKLFAEYSFNNEKIITLSSCSWITKKQSNVVKESHKHKSVNKNNDPHLSQGIVFRVFARFINPLMRDVLICVALNKK